MQMQQEHNRLFSQLPPTKLFFRCALPNMVSMAVTSLYTVADGIFVGRFLGAGALAAVNLVMPFIIISFALADMVAVGSSVQISIKLGEKDSDAANRIFSFACALIFAISIFIGVVAYVFADDLVHLMGADPSVAKLAVEYMRVYAIFSPLIMIFFALDNYLRICGKVQYSMWMNVVISVGNIVLDWFFLSQLGWGAWSAAFASCLSLMVGTVVCLVPFFRKKLLLRFTKGRLSLSAIGNMLANGSSEFFSNIASSTYMVIINVALLQIAGYRAVAAFSIVMYVDTIIKSMVFGMADSLQPAISYNFGAGDRKRVFALERRAMAAGAIISAAVMLWMLLGGEGIISLFVKDSDPDLLSMSVRAMILFAISYLFSWFNTISSSFFTALNYPVFSLAVAFSNTLIFPLLCLNTLPRLLGLDGVWLTAAFAGFLTMILAGILMVFAVKRLRAKDSN